MNGLAGICYRDGRVVNEGEVHSMLTALAYRGSDGVGVRCKGSAGFGQRIHQTLPEPLPNNLPLFSHDLMIVADARIDNRSDLISTLRLEPKLAEAMHDFEFILAAYERWGEDCPTHLLGDFSFVIWNFKTRSLFAARDHFGVKPLFYHQSRKGLFFASEVKALLRVNEVPHRLNEHRLGDFFLPTFEETKSTLYESIFHLPPAHSLVWNKASCSIHRYWTLESQRNNQSAPSPKEWHEAYREIFLESVKCRVRASSRVGFLVSGGVDSSSVICSATHVLGDAATNRLQMFSGVYDNARMSDERKYGDIVAQHCRLTPIYAYPDQLSPLTDWDTATEFEDEPLLNPQMPLRWSVYQFAKEQNVRVMLDGYGGDGVVSNGVGFLTELLLSGRWGKLYNEASGVARRHHRSVPHLIWKYGVKPILPFPIQQLWSRVRERKRFGLSRIPLQEEFVRRVRLHERAVAVACQYDKPPQTLREIHYRELVSGLYPAAFECFNRTSALFGIEPRHPFFDKRLVEFSLAVPAEEKLQDGWTRHIARRAMAGILPDEIRWRRDKGDLSYGFHHALLRGDTNVLDEICSDRYGGIGDFVDLARLRKTFLRYRAKPNNLDGVVLWRVVVIARWLRRSAFG
jgi:asparagine synthase (glutamine-hydrolysing)